MSRKPAIKKAFERILAIALRGHQTGAPLSAVTREQPWTSADLVHQDALYSIQNELLSMLLELAREIDGVNDGATVRQLSTAMPWAFASREAVS